MQTDTLARRICRGWLLLAIAAGLASPAWCQAIAGWSGQVELTGIPGSLLPGAFESDTAASIFQESSNLILVSDVAFDAGLPGLYDSPASLTPGVITAGTTVSDAYFHSDPIERTGTVFTGSVTFNSDILGVIALSATLSATDSIFGAAGLVYPGHDGGRGLEMVPGQDSFAISQDLRTLTFSVMTWGNVDEMRIITAGTPGKGNEAAAAPEPGTGLLLAAGFAAFACRKLVRG